MALEKIRIQVDTVVKGAIQNVDKLKNKFSQTAKSASGLGNKLTSSFTGMGDAISNTLPIFGRLRMAIAATGMNAFTAVVAGIIGIFGSAARKGAEFDKSLAGLRAITSATKDQLALLSDQAKLLGSTTAFTASEVVALQTELAKLGFTIGDIKNATPAILDLSASLEVSLSEAAMFAGSVVRSFGLTTEETQRVVDTLAKSTSLSALNFEALRESLKLAAPTAKALGISVEKTTALLGVLADSGLKGSIAGTGLSKVFIMLSKEGLTLEQGMEKVRNSSNKLNTAIDLVGIVGAKTLLNLADQGSKIETLTTALEGSEGAARALAEIRLDNLAGDMTKLSSAWEGFLLDIEDGEGTMNAISRGAIQFLTNAISALGIAIDTIGFTFGDMWEIAKNLTMGSVKVISGQLSKLGANMKIFANESLIAMSKVPIIGGSIDKEAAQQRIDEAKLTLIDAQTQIQEGIAMTAKAFAPKVSAYARALMLRVNNQEKQITKQLAETSEGPLDTGSGELSEEDKDKMKKKAEAIAAFIKKLNRESEDAKANDELKKINLAEQRRLQELNDLEVNETQKQELIKKIADHYNFLRSEIKVKTDAENLENIEKERKMRLQANQERLDQLMMIAGQETTVGRALFLVKQGLIIKEMIANAKASIAKVSAKSSEAAVDIAAGSAKAAASAPPPANLVPIGIYAAQIIPIVAQIASAVSQAKRMTKMGGSTPSLGGLKASGSGQKAPDFNIVGSNPQNQLAETIASEDKKPIKAYVVGTEISNEQALQRNIEEAATIG